MTGVDSTNLSVSGGGVGALESEGDCGTDTPSLVNCFLCSAFCFRSCRSASSSALRCSLVSTEPDLVAAPIGRFRAHDI